MPIEDFIETNSAPICGVFKATDSFAIKRRNEFYIIGKLESGEVQEGWFARIGLNSSVTITIRITQIETVEMSNETESYQLLIAAANSEAIDFFLILGIGSEYVFISTEGEDIMEL